MDENIKIKEELFSLYKDIKTKINQNKEIISEDITSYNTLSLINEIKDFIQYKLPLINSSTENNDTKNIDTKNLLKDYKQLENQIIKLEIDNKYYLKNFLSYKIQKESLEMKLNAYMSIEEEYEELKEKVKYEGGKFLDNDRKDNEIIIIRSENSSLKKEITKIELKNKNIEIKNKEYLKKIKDLENNIEILNKRIYKLEKIIKDNTVKNNYLNRNNTNSCTNIRMKSNDNFSNRLNNNSNYNSDYSLANLKNIIHLNSSNNNRKLPNFRVPKNDIIYLEHNKKNNNNTINAINTNAFSPSYNKVINGITNKKITIPIKKEFTIIKHQRNNSISILRDRENNESKTFSLNKFNKENEKYFQKSDNKMKNSNKIFNSNSKTNNLYPLSCKNSKNNGHIVRKYIQKEMIRNSSYQNIKKESKS